MRKHYFASYIYINKDGKTATSSCVIDCKRIKNIKDINSIAKSIEADIAKDYNIMEDSVVILSLTKL